jgi:uncharacterized tellurite resistance protein B-like protein
LTLNTDLQATLTRDSTMSNSQVVFSLAKVLIAAAWSDGTITQEEIHSLKDLLFRLPNINGLNWAKLEMYLETPVGDEERKRLIEDLGHAISSPAEKQLALQTLQDMVEADGVLTENEKIVVQEVHTALEGTVKSAFENIGQFLKGLIDTRSEKLAHAPNRELQFEDFIKNKIYYKVQQVLKENGRTLEVSENDLRKLCLAGGLMARIAQKDNIVTKEESSSILEAFKKHWGVDDDVAHLVTEISLLDVCTNLDYYRLTRDFYAMTTPEERTQFVNILFDVARSDGHASHDETEEIRTISESLKFDHSQFILAKTNK